MNTWILRLIVLKNIHVVVEKTLFTPYIRWDLFWQNNLSLIQKFTCTWLSDETTLKGLEYIPTCISSSMSVDNIHIL